MDGREGKEKDRGGHGGEGGRRGEGICRTNVKLLPTRLKPPSACHTTGRDYSTRE